MTAQARTGTSGDGALSINQDHRTRELWRKASEQLPDNRRGEEERVETHKTELQDCVDRWCNCVLKQRLRQIRKLMLGPGKLARKNVERRSSLALAQLDVTKPRGSKRLRAVLAADLFCCHATGVDLSKLHMCQGENPHEFTSKLFNHVTDIA